MFNCVMEVKTIIFFFMVIISSDCEEVKKNLTGTEGGSITLPDPLKGHGFLLFGENNIAMVNEEKITIYKGKYKDRLLWNKNTGLFTITGLQRNDSGIYTIDPKVEGRPATYRVTVYESVPTPAVNKVNVSAESCTLLCSVERAEETTLLWYKDEVIVNQSSSDLSLPLTVHEQDFSSSYRCVAANPAENKTLPVNAIISCGGQNITEDGERHHIIIGILIPIVFAVLVLLVACTIKWKCFDKKTRHTQDSVNREAEDQYTICEYRRQGGRGTDSSGPVDRSNLTTIFYKLVPHRMVHTDTADQTMDDLQT
ncbi:uncharacterized protein [Pagrus major]|uniref:uncharacterized protein n=1 Tax=Pagrus major TaxID=143350 RepID=UPI003CC862F3